MRTGLSAAANCSKSAVRGSFDALNNPCQMRPSNRIASPSDTSGCTRRVSGSSSLARLRTHSFEWSVRERPFSKSHLLDGLAAVRASNEPEAEKIACHIVETYPRSNEASVGRRGIRRRRARDEAFPVIAGRRRRSTGSSRRRGSEEAARSAAFSWRSLSPASQEICPSTRSSLADPPRVQAEPGSHDIRWVRGASPAQGIHRARNRLRLQSFLPPRTR